MGTAAYSRLDRRGSAPPAMPRVPTRSQTSAQPRVVDHTGIVRRNLVGPLLIASGEGRPLSGAIRLAEALARRDGVNAHVLSVARPLSSPLSPLVCSGSRPRAPRAGGVPTTDTAGPRSTAGPRDRRTLRPLQYGRRTWRTCVHHRRHRPATGSGVHLGGSPGSGLARQSESRRRGVPAGEGRRRPVLAVPATSIDFPRSVLVNMDLGVASVRAARATLPLLAAGGSLTLAHVVPEVEFAPPDAGDWVEVGARGVADVLRRLGDELRLAGDLEVHSVVLRGDPARVLSELAQDFDLIAVGAPKRRSFGRFLMGSVSADVLRAAGSTVLIVPGRDG